MFTSGHLLNSSGALNGYQRYGLSLLGAMFLLAALSPAATAQTRLPELDQLCSEQQSNVEYKGCLHRHYLAVDRELNRVWKKVIAAIRRNDYLERKDRKSWENLLREAQRNWVRFKDIDCNEAVGYEWFGGTGAGSAISLCLIRHTVLRTENLVERYLADR